MGCPSDPTEGNVAMVKNEVHIHGTLLLSLEQACINLKFYIDAEMRRFLDQVRPDAWYPFSHFAGVMNIVSSRYAQPAPIAEQIGVEMMRSWYHHGPGREIIKRGIDFLHFQTSSQGYTSVMQGPAELMGDFTLESLDDEGGTAVVVSSTPFDKNLERGILLGGLGLPGDLVYINVDNSSDPQRYEIRVSSRAPLGKLPTQPVDADTFLSAEELGNHHVLEGTQLRQVFWHHRAMKLEIERLQAFWGSTNETLASSFRLLQESREELSRSYDALERERQKSERLLLNILPAPVAARLKESPGVIAEELPDVTIMFVDMVGFSGLAGRISATELIGMLNEVFSLFDDIAERHGIEKIKTIGDAYMAVCNLTRRRADHVEAMASMALEIQERLRSLPLVGGQPLQVRTGINSGLVVAGVIGTAKFSYDVWGDTVNIASRMESAASPGEILVAEPVYQRIKDRFRFSARRMVDVKYKGLLPTYFLLGRR